MVSGQMMAPGMSKKPHLMMVGSRDTEYPYDGDFFSTPAEATHALCRVESFSGSIWEPAAGSGAISQVLVEHGYAVTSTDLLDHGFCPHGLDFLKASQSSAPNIVTNPPYRYALEFAQKATNIAEGKVAFLLRLVWLEGQRRRQFFEQHPPARVWVFSRRIPRMHRDGYEGHRTSSTIAFAWFVWEAGFKGSPSLGWI